MYALVIAIEHVLIAKKKKEFFSNQWRKEKTLFLNALYYGFNLSFRISHESQKLTILSALLHILVQQPTLNAETVLNLNLHIH